MVAASNGEWDIDESVTPLLITLKITGLLLLVVIVVRRPEQTVARTKRVLESFADLAGFWAPDLHPLAGTSYRLAVLRGLRRGVRDMRTDVPDKPIALVGHSQGAVICAWFIRGGHWRERPSENYSDEHALATGMHDTLDEQSDRIALFTCGSPLGSLYRTFFPRYFDEHFVRAAARNSYGNVWHNYWRKTDPFGARLSRGAEGTAVDGSQVCDIDVTELEGALRVLAGRPRQAGYRGVFRLVRAPRQKPALSERKGRYAPQAAGVEGRVAPAAPARELIGPQSG
jgi:hypothetical protein